jgi:hypothetical protein
MDRPYDYRNCQSLFGYAAKVHVRSRATCQLCGCGGSPVDFNLWRQMTVEHLLGRSQGGYLRQIREALVHRFSGLTTSAIEDLAAQIDAMNTVTACSFCNSTTSRDVSAESMTNLILSTPGTAADVAGAIEAELQVVLARKRRDVRWKLEAVREAFDREVLAKIQQEGS